MAKVKITGHASGTGVLTVTAPNTSTDRTITLPDTTGTLLDENSSVPAANLTGTVADARISALTASKLTGALPAISGASLTSLPVQGIAVHADGWLRAAPTTDQNSNAVVDFATSFHLGSNCSESGGRITVGTAGWYLVSFHISNQSAFSDNMSMQLRKGGSTQLGRLYWEGNTEINYMGMDATVLIQCSANDILDIYGTGYFSGNTNSASLTWFSGVRIGTN